MDGTHDSCTEDNLICHRERVMLQWMSGWTVEPWDDGNILWSIQGCPGRVCMTSWSFQVAKDQTRRPDCPILLVLLHHSPLLALPHHHPCTPALPDRSPLLYPYQTVLIVFLNLLHHKVINGECILPNSPLSPYTTTYYCNTRWDVPVKQTDYSASREKSIFLILNLNGCKDGSV